MADEKPSMPIVRLRDRAVPATPAWCAARRVAARLHQAGYEAVIVGGAVRDWLLDLPGDDVDIATSATPAQVEELFERSWAVGAQFGVVVVGLHGQDVEVASFRSDEAYIDGRRPQGVVFTDEATDVQRRDFTINALLYDPLRDELRDHVAGLADLAARRLRVVGDPQARLQEDRLRVLRGYRFAARFALQIAASTRTALHRTPLVGLSRERIWTEWDKAMQHSSRATWWRLVAEDGHAADCAPPLQDAERSIIAAALAVLPVDAPALLGQAVCLHRCQPEAICDWLQGEPISRRRQRLLRWLLLEARPDRVRTLAGRAQRLLLQADGAELLPAWWRALGVEADVIDEWQQRLQVERQQPLRCLLSGEDLIDLGLRPGPAIGGYLRGLEEAQADGAVSTRAEAVAWVRQQLAEAMESDEEIP